VACKSGGGRLAVCSGNADYRAFEIRRGQLNFADYVNAARPRTFQRREIGGNARGEDNQIPGFVEYVIALEAETEDFAFRLRAETRQPPAPISPSRPPVL
jgi:hypothetical protein